MSAKHSIIVWGILVAVVIVPLLLAINSPLLQWREPVYIVAGFAGVIAMSLLLFQPLLAAGSLPGATGPGGRRIHRYTGSALLLAVVLHVVCLWITSPPDVVDALLYRSPTAFSSWGVTAMWGLFATAAVAAFRQKYRIAPRVWSTVHKALAAVIVVASVVHAMLIDGTMETVSKLALCLMVLIITFIVITEIGLGKFNSLTRVKNRHESAQ